MSSRRCTQTLDNHLAAPSAVAHPAGLMYTAHHHQNPPGRHNWLADGVVHAWDDHQHSVTPSFCTASSEFHTKTAGRLCQCLHLDGGRLGVADENTLAGPACVATSGSMMDVEVCCNPSSVVDRHHQWTRSRDSHPRPLPRRPPRLLRRSPTWPTTTSKPASASTSNCVAPAGVRARGGLPRRPSVRHLHRALRPGRLARMVACVTMLSTCEHEMFGKDASPMWKFMQRARAFMARCPDPMVTTRAAATTLLILQSPCRQMRLRWDGPASAAANDIIFVWDGLTEPQDMLPVLGRDGRVCSRAPRSSPRNLMARRSCGRK